MNKLIFAFGIAVATTFASNTKIETNNANSMQEPCKVQVEELTLVNNIDSVNTIKN